MSTNRCCCETCDESSNSHSLNCLRLHEVIQHLQALTPILTLAQHHMISVLYINQPNSDDLSGMISKENDFPRGYNPRSVSSEEQPL